MRTNFTRSLDEMSTQMVEMNHLVGQAVHDANRALRTADGALAESVIGGDGLIDAFYAEIEENAIDLLARESPVARDLRLVVTSLQLSASLERTGDLARHVAELVRLRLPELAVPAPARETVTEMGRLALALVQGAGEALATHRSDAAERLEVLDDSLDALHLRVFEIIRTEVTDTREAADLALLSRYYERIGDHSVSVGRRVGYLVTGHLDRPSEDAHAVTVPHP
ncbi:phosphate signaling complex protein PhoU [Kytococcus sp. Marseille-QA3725]